MDIDFEELKKYHAVHCARGRICSSQCVSQCQTNKPMKPEDMVKYGWTLEAAKKHQEKVLGHLFLVIDQEEADLSRKTNSRGVF